LRWQEACFQRVESLALGSADYGTNILRAPHWAIETVGTLMDIAAR